MSDMDAINLGSDATVSTDRVQLGSLFAHRTSLDDALDIIVARCRSGHGGYVVTPNVDHVCVAEIDSEFGQAHRNAFLSLVDGTPLLWLAKLCKNELPEKISGSDLIVPLCRRAAADGLKVAMFGASERASLKAFHELQSLVPGLDIVARVCPRYSRSCSDPEAEQETKEAVASVCAVAPDIVFVAMGTPNQELFMAEYADTFAPAVMCGIGAGFDFIAAERRRAPKWVQRLGLEWLVRLVQEPSRLWRRYLVRDRAIFRIGLQQIRQARSLGKEPR
jgi:N-acetylglucosaminyldiphosphoundecaprenol N-acetyl-beta-D-mannosaminyltransferase